MTGIRASWFSARGAGTHLLGRCRHCRDLDIFASLLGMRRRKEPLSTCILTLRGPCFRYAPAGFLPDVRWCSDSDADDMTVPPTPHVAFRRSDIRLRDRRDKPPRALMNSLRCADCSPAIFLLLAS